MADNAVKKIDLTTGIGTLSFPHVFSSTKTKNDKGEDVYDIQFIIPKTQRDDVRAILVAIKTVGEAKWGANWKKVRTPLRDGDAEADDLTEDGSTKGDKYPERKGCYFMNARSTKPVGVFDRQRTPIENPDDLYGGCKGRISVTFYPYSTSGNNGIGVGLNGVQKVSDGESFGGGRPSVESMFDMLDDEDGLDVDAVDEVDEAPVTPTKKAAAKRPAKKAAAKAVEVEVEEDDDLTVGDEGDDATGDMYDDI